MEKITINHFPLQVKEYNGQRVVTFKDIDAVHGRPNGTARKRFNDNRKHFIEGEDYFKVCVSEIRTNKIMDISPKTQRDIILITESGYLMLVKSFTDDLAWSVQRQLVNSYFRLKDISYKQLFFNDEPKYEYFDKTLTLCTNSKVFFCGSFFKICIDKFVAT
ncbi:MAG: ORF6N domain-containing protein [Ruminococcus sp.]|nr:ORF6N domain-containing protein [Ruminococcus sp.]